MTQKEISCRYYYKHQKEILKKAKQYYLKHRKECINRCRIYHKNNREKENERCRKWGRKHPRDKKAAVKNAMKWARRNKHRAYLNRRKHHLKVTYGLTIKDFNRMHKFQKGKCLLCRGVPRELVIDHDHKSGKVRGLLCQPCNRGLGSFQDSLPKLKKAVAYLERRASL